MKKMLFLFVVLLLLPIAPGFSQTLGDYVKQVKGDTLVIKSFSDMNIQPSSLYWALVLDSAHVPAGRVYELQAGGVYPQDFTKTINSSAAHPTVIVGADGRMVATNKDPNSAPPIICGYTNPLSSPGGIGASGDLTIKNCELVPGANDGTVGWAFTVTNAPNLHLLYDNCIMERTRWIIVVTGNPNCNATFRNCYFVNMTGQPCRRSGGVFDNFCNMDTLIVENCTHINACGSLYRFRNVFAGNLGSYERIVFNHNTFVNCAGYVFMNPGGQNNISLTNNLFVNSNIQSYPGIHSIDTWEQDPDWLPMGLVNIYPDSADVANNTPRRFLCQANLAYWDPSLTNMDSILNANRVNGLTNWRSQMIIMNSRTDSMFKHIGRFSTKPYSSLATDIWKDQLPHFTDPRDLLTNQLAILKAYALATVDTGNFVPAGLLPAWRLVNTGSDKFVYPDWPIQVDLSYSDAGLKTAGLGGFPLGDLNWFPAQKAAWLSARTAESTAIQNALDGGTLVSAGHDHAALPGSFRLDQDYPNPFNPTTTITYELPQAVHVRLTVYDILGREVQTLVNDFKQPGRYEAVFNAGNLASGAYFYRLQAGSFVEARKLVLLR